MEITFDKMILGTILRSCDRCGTQTFWFRSQQRKHGCCIEHSSGGDTTEAEAVGTIMTIFRGRTDRPAATGLDGARGVRAMGARQRGVVDVPGDARRPALRAPREGLGATSGRGAVPGLRVHHPGVRARRLALLPAVRERAGVDR